MEWAGFWPRAGALALDLLILFPPMWALSLLFGYPIFGQRSPDGQVDFPLTASITNSLIWLLYSTIFISSPLKATPGKRLMRLTVGRPDGGRLSFSQAFARIGVLFPLNLPFWLEHANLGVHQSFHWAVLLADFVLGIDVLLLIFTRRNTAGHDLLCGTRVFRGPPHVRHFKRLTPHLPLVFPAPAAKVNGGGGDPRGGHVNGNQQDGR
ncbi:RDD family protein [Nitrospirillum viridazoti]|uniref:RDD domain-containing protein n=1 Tax=Nitrospirillum viridazoti CBAmc TaxID=1441467 RepID=A0A248JYS4_9PROT|nr:hypothetical protein Y958_21380 [Nitrospirillum amazonense CBAmc]